MLKGDTSDLDRLQYGGHPVLPEQGSYSVGALGGVVSSSSSGGMDKQQVQFQNSPYDVNVTYECLDGGEVLFLKSFLDNHRGEKFIATLLVGSTELEEFVVQVTNSPKFPMTGYSGSVSITYQVEPAVDYCFLSWVAEFGQCSTMQDWSQIFCYTEQAIESLPEGTSND